MNLRTFLKNQPNQTEIFRFPNQDEAYTFGQKMKEIARKEEKAPTIFDLQKFIVDVGWLTVRVRNVLPKVEIPVETANACPKKGLTK